MTNETINIEKQVAKSNSSNKTFRPFKKNQSSNSQPLNIIYNAESDQDSDEEKT